MVTKVWRCALTLVAIATFALPGIVAAAELVTAELQGTANDVLVDRGSSATLVIAVSVSGLAECRAFRGDLRAIDGGRDRLPH